MLKSVCWRFTDIESGRTGMFTFASEETYDDGQVIIKEGTAGDWLYVVLSGAVEISKMIQGKKYVIDVLKEGELFGEVGFLGGKNAPPPQSPSATPPWALWTEPFWTLNSTNCPRILETS
jgi:hypothetical protein